MHISHLLIKISVLIIFVVSAYRALSSLNTKSLLDFLFNGSVAIVAFAYLFN
jgi:hypothetical protein